MAAVLNGCPGDAVAPMNAAADVAQRFGETGGADSLGFMFGPFNAGVYRMSVDADNPDQVVSIARGLHPESHPFAVTRAHYWSHYGRALAKLRGRHEDAVRALRTAEDIFPTKVRRDAFVRDTLAVLLRHSRSGSPADQELRGMARRAGLPV